jgi:hypothetical protein
MPLDENARTQALGGWPGLDDDCATICQLQSGDDRDVPDLEQERRVARWLGAEPPAAPGCEGAG